MFSLTVEPALPVALYSQSPSFLTQSVSPTSPFVNASMFSSRSEIPAVFLGLKVLLPVNAANATATIAIIDNKKYFFMSKNNYGYGFANIRFTK